MLCIRSIARPIVQTLDNCLSFEYNLTIFSVFSFYFEQRRGRSFAFGATGVWVSEVLHAPDESLPSQQGYGEKDALGVFAC
jgi:hypothetical protein